MTVALACEKVSVRFGTVEAVREVSFSVETGERVALFGLNGSGKTTLLLAAAGLVPSTGTIQVAGETMTKKTAAMLRDQIGFLFGVPDDQLLFPDVEEDIGFALRRRGTAKKETAARVSAVMEALGIAALAGRSPHELSQGQRQRVALAGALVADPELLLLDEPSAALDAVGKAALANVLRAVPSAMVMATHDLGFARAVCSRFVIMEDGRIISDSADAETIARYESSVI